MLSDRHLFTLSSNSFTHYPSSERISVIPILNASKFGKDIVRHRKELWVEDRPGPFYRKVTISTLPDDALLEIFKFYVDEVEYDDDGPDEWHALVHVCRRWRNVMFASPRCLNLQLLCTLGRSVTRMIQIWPKLPIIIFDVGYLQIQDADNVIAALKLNNRVSRINLGNISSSVLVLKKFVAVMQVSFPMLTELLLSSSDEKAPVFPDSFLGGSAPRLQLLDLKGIPFPALPTLLLSATSLVHLHLLKIPHSGYISPEAMVTALASLRRLEELTLHFRFPRSRPDRASLHLPPSTRIILPSLAHLCFKGSTEYLEDLVARIDVPLLEKLDILFFNQLIFDVPHLSNFLSRTQNFISLGHVDVAFLTNSINITISPNPGTVGPTWIDLGISCSKLDWQLSSLAQVCGQGLSTFSNFKGLSIHEYQYLPPLWQDDIENRQWVDLLRPFSTVDTLYLSKEVVPYVAQALQELAGEQVTEVLPALQNIFLDGLQPSRPVREAMGQFVTAREFSDLPVALHLYERKK